MQHVVLAIVKTERIPCRMLMAFAWIEELIRVACKISQSFNLVFHCMRVYDIHYDGDTVFMCSVDEFLELFRCTKPA